MLYMVLTDYEEGFFFKKWCGQGLRQTHTTWDNIQNGVSYLKKLVIVLLHLHVTDGT